MKTPFQAAYAKAAADNPGAVILLRVGDFYEAFGDHAVSISRALGLTLITRDKGSADPLPMAGFPYHTLMGYCRKLQASGQRVAIFGLMNDGTIGPEAYGDAILGTLRLEAAQ